MRIQLIDVGTLGNAADFGDIGVQSGHASQFGARRAVALEIVQVRDAVDQDVCGVGQIDQIVIGSGVAGEHHGTVWGVETIGQGREGVAVRDGYSRDPCPGLVKHRDGALGPASDPCRGCDVDGANEVGRVGHLRIERHDIEVVGETGEDAVHQVGGPRRRSFRVDGRTSVKRHVTDGQRRKTSGTVRTRIGGNGPRSSLRTPQG